MSMAECKQAVLVEKETAHRDCLTGCYDKMTIQYLVDLCFLKSDVRQSHAMFVIDVDNFKRGNDTWGREFGDIVLNDVAAVLTISAGSVTMNFLSCSGMWSRNVCRRKRRRNFIRPSARCFPPVAMSAINRHVVSA